MQGISQAIQQHAQRSPSGVLLRLGEVEVSYGELPGLVLGCAERLASELPGPDAARPVGLVGGSTPGMVVHLFALWHLGYGVLPMSDRLPDAERRRVAQQAGVGVTVRVEESVAEGASLDTQRTDGPVELRGWLALPSSGTTGGSKVVRREAAAVDAVACQVCTSVGYLAGDTVFAAVPLTHAYGLEAGLLAPLLAGSRVELENAFTPDRLAQRIHETGATILPAVPAMVDMLVQMHRGEPGEPAFPTLRRLLCAGATLPEPLWYACRDKLGLEAANYYGATEMGSVCLADPHEPGHDAGWLGRPMPGVAMHIVDPDSRVPVSDGMTGEIAVDAPSLMTGYIDALGEAEHEPPFTEIAGRRCFLTGDLGVRGRDGHFRFVARRKLLIDVGANKVNPMEVEAILRLHPGVREALVGEERLNHTISRLNAVIEPTDDDAPPTAAELRRHCRHHLAPWKVPRTFACEHLPRTALGKVIRHAQPDEALSAVPS
ncbi:MAG: class I adenylate-forming enzyme family protein [Planctomycetota bacterium]